MILPHYVINLVWSILSPKTIIIVTKQTVIRSYAATFSILGFDYYKELDWHGARGSWNKFYTISSPRIYLSFSSSSTIILSLLLICIGIDVNDFKFKDELKQAVWNYWHLTRTYFIDYDNFYSITSHPIARSVLDLAF